MMCLLCMQSLPIPLAAHREPGVLHCSQLLVLQSHLGLPRMSLLQPLLASRAAFNCLYLQSLCLVLSPYMTAQAQEGLISQLCDENLKLAEEIQRLNTRSACKKRIYCMGPSVNAACFCWLLSASSYQSIKVSPATPTGRPWYTSGFGDCLNSIMGMVLPCSRAADGPGTLEIVPEHMATSAVFRAVA